MRGLWILLLGSFKTNIKQTAIIITVMTLTATMLFSAFALLQNANSTIYRVLDDHHTSHLTLWFDDDKHDYQSIYDYFNSHEDVAYTTHNAMIFGGGVLDVNGNTVRTNEIVIANIETYDENINRLRLVEGSALSSDPKGLWVSTAFAYGENIEVGDVFSFTEGGETFTFNVVGIVFDPIYSSEFMPPRLWVNEQRFNEILSAHGTLSHAINVFLYNIENESLVWNAFLASINYNFLGYQMNYDTVSMAHSMLTNIIGASLLGFSMILVFVGAFVIYSVLKRTILQHTKVIGVLKSQGFRSRQIRWRYVLQFLIIAAIAILGSMFLGTFAVRFIGAFMMRNLGLDGSELSLSVGLIISSSFMIVVVLISAFIATRKISIITPTDAVRYEGFVVKKKYKNKHHTTWTDHLSIPIQLGLKQCSQKRGQTLFSTVLAFFTAFTIFYGVSGIVSLEDSFENMAFWGEDNRHLTLMLNNDDHRDDFETFLQNESSIQGLSVFDELPAAILPLKGENTRMLSAFVYDDFEALQVQNIEGLSPQTLNQASISTVIADVYQLTIGDIFEVSILGEIIQLEVTGIYQTVVHMGNNIRVHKSTIESLGHLFNTTIIRLDHSANIETFLLTHQDTFSSLSVTAREGSDMQGVFTLLSDILSPVMGFISLIFIGITLIILSNFVLISIFESRKDYGIYKSFGMTTNQIRMTVITQFIITTLLGGFLGIIIGMWTVPFILLQTMRSFGFLNFPFSNPVSLALLIPFILLGVVIISIWVSTSSIRKISPRELITE